MNYDRCFIGKESLKSINEDVLFLSPSVRRDRPELMAAAERGTLISPDAELFFSIAKNDVFAVTGSDGKSTTTYLISKMLNASGIHATAAGNYGKSLASLAYTDTAVVAELSSFQLQYMAPRSRCAVITNITPNHLNWHTSLSEYVSSKLNLLKHARRVTVDYDSEILRSAIAHEDIFAAVSLSLDYSELKSKMNAENYLTARGGTVYLNGEPYFGLKNAKRRESYNTKNFMLAAAATLGITSPANITDTVNSFTGLPHRAETVASKNGISYIDSSIDSSPERTLKTLAALRGNVVPIICGAGKGLSLDTLADKLPQLTCGAVLMGEIGCELAALLSKKKTDYVFLRADNMKDAILLAESFLGEGGTVILSPAGTSYDMYANFEERGRDFKNTVLLLLNNK